MINLSFKTYDWNAIFRFIMFFLKSYNYYYYYKLQSAVLFNYFREF